MKDAVIVDACRSPVGRAGDRGVYRAIGPADLMVPVLKAIMERNNLDPAEVDDIVMGSAGLSGIRGMLLVAGFPISVAGTDTQRACASSSQAIAIASHYVMNDDADIMIAAGLELQGRRGPVTPDAIGRRGSAEMRGESRRGRPGAPTGSSQEDYPEDWKHANTIPGWPTDIPSLSMGQTAEELSERFNISREDADEYAYHTQMRYAAAKKAGLFQYEIVPITINYKDGTSETITDDQCPRPDTTLEKIKALPPAFKENGRVTAGNSCPQNDGAGAVLIMSKEKAKELGMKPMVTIRHAVAIGVDPTVMGIGPYPATAKLLKRTGMTIKDIDIYEINEAFACQVLYSGRMLGFGPEEWDKVNPKGGSIAIGHPLGMTGTRQAAVCVHEMVRRNLQFGIATLCVGGGQGMATLFERENYD